MVADRDYVIEKGQIRWHGVMADLERNQEVQSAYLTV
jgi:ABC-type branched-subunit amino acid transport system ATPase component